MCVFTLIICLIKDQIQVLVKQFQFWPTHFPNNNNKIKKKGIKFENVSEASARVLQLIKKKNKIITLGIKYSFVFGLYFEKVKNIRELIN